MSKPGGKKENENQKVICSAKNLIQEESEADETFTVLQINQRRLNGDNRSEENILQIKMDRVTHNLGQDLNESSETIDEAFKINALPNIKRDSGQNGSSNISMENVKSSTEETTLEERRDTRDNSAYEICPSNQTLTDIDSLPVHFVADAHKRRNCNALQKSVKISNKMKACHCPKRRDLKKEVCLIDDCDADFTKQNNVHQHSTLNRYNSSHVQIYQTTRHSARPWYYPFMSKKKRYKLKNMAKYNKPYSTSESGETVPQLYKAKMIADLTSIPKIFKFRAVTGTPGPHFMKHHRREIPLMHKDERQVTDERIHYDDGKYKINRNHCMNCNFMKKHKHTQKQPIPVKSDGQIGVQKTLYDTSNVRACLNLDGTEYISTKELPQRIDVYCFDHLNTSYFRTTDQPPPLMTDEAIQRTEDLATRFWAEIFGFCHLFISFVTAFILQFYKFILFSFIRPLLSGVVQLTSDYLLKPLLTIFYNGFFQPGMVFLFNLATSFRDVCQPLARGLGYFLSEFAVLLRAIRIAEWNRVIKKPAIKDSYC